MRIIVLLASVLMSCCVSAIQLKQMVIFGDSLSDNGNLYEYFQQKIPPSPPYFNGRFSNGPVWIERLVSSYYSKNADQHMLNYAFGGAAVSDDADEDALFTLAHEVDTYLLAHGEKADPDSLFIIWIGANNYVMAFDSDEKTVQVVVDGIANAMKRLADLGAKHIMVMNLPDTGKTPFAKEMDMEAQLSSLVVANNQALENTVNMMKNTYPNVQWLYFDAYGVTNDIMTHPEQYGITNVSDTCYELDFTGKTKMSIIKMAVALSVTHTQNACDGYLFFDPAHSTAPAHQVVADKVKAFLEQNEITF